MRQVTLHIKESKYKFFLELIKNFDFIKIEEKEPEPDSDEEIRRNLRKSFKELKAIKSKKAKTTSFNEFLDEL